jgi:hypothetical protein
MAMFNAILLDVENYKKKNVVSQTYQAIQLSSLLARSSLASAANRLNKQCKFMNVAFA